MKKTLFTAYILAATLLILFAPQLLVSELTATATHTQNIKY